MTEVTRILNAVEQGDERAAEQLLPIVYDELRRLAAQRLSHEEPGQTLQATALVHEAYIRLVGGDDQCWDGRGHFFAAAAEAMRRTLVDNARHKKGLNRDNHRHRIGLDNVELAVETPSDDLVALDEALAKLATQDAVSAELVKMRYFAGLTAAQAAKALGISRSTADRTWAHARAWLYREIHKGN